MKRKITMWGLHAPRPFIWMLGFVHGRFKMAELDPDTGHITSGYITIKSKLFHELAFRQGGYLEKDTRKSWEQISQLLLEESQLCTGLMENGGPVSRNSNAEKRACDRAADRHASMSRRHNEILKNLSKLDSDLRSHELEVRQGLGAAAQALESRFATYASGVLLKPVHPNCLPDLAYNQPFDEYHIAYQDAYQKMSKVLHNTELEG